MAVSTGLFNAWLRFDLSRSLSNELLNGVGFASVLKDAYCDQLTSIQQ